MTIIQPGAGNDGTGKPKAISESSSKTASSAKASGNSSVNPSDWMNSFKTIQLRGLNDVRSFIHKIKNTNRQSRPDLVALDDLVNQKYLEVFPVSRTMTSNPDSKTYSELGALIPSYQNGDTKCLYSSPSADPAFKHSKKTVILIPDWHTNDQIRRHNYQLQKALYGDTKLAMSSSLVEGKNDPETLAASMPASLKNQIGQLVDAGRINPEAALLYEAKQLRSMPNSEHIKFRAEDITETQETEALMHSLIAISSGVYNQLFPQEHFDSANQIFGLLSSAFSEASNKGLTHEFLITFTLKLEEALESSGLSESLQTQLFNQAVDIFLNNYQMGASDNFASWQQYYSRIPMQIRSTNDYEKLSDFYRARRQEHALNKRNPNIVASIRDSESGTRSMIVGINHIDKKFAGDLNLIELFEKENIPVIVLGHKDFSDRF